MNWWDRLTAVPRRGVIAVVDGGATRSRVAVVGDDGSLRGWAIGGPTNSRSVGESASLDNVCATIDAALADASIAGADVGLCLTTSASIDTADISDFLSAGIRERSLPQAVVPVVPDTLGCWAVTADLRPAVAVIAGTGSVVLAADRERRRWDRLGGWDFLLDDEGSGFALGRAALREVMFVSEGRVPDTGLAEQVLAAFGVPDADHVGDAVHKPAIDKARIADLAKVLLGAADDGHERARTIVGQEVEPLAAAVAFGLGLIDAEVVPLGLFGGAFSSPTFRRELLSRVTTLANGRAFASTEPRTAIVGAFQVAVALRGASLDESAVAADRFDTQLDARTA